MRERELVQEQGSNVIFVVVSLKFLQCYIKQGRMWWYNGLQISIKSVMQTKAPPVFQGDWCLSLDSHRWYSGN